MAWWRKPANFHKSAGGGNGAEWKKGQGHVRGRCAGMWYGQFVPSAIPSGVSQHTLFVISDFFWLKMWQRFVEVHWWLGLMKWVKENIFSRGWRVHSLVRVCRGNARRHGCMTSATQRTLTVPDQTCLAGKRSQIILLPCLRELLNSSLFISLKLQS